MVAADLIGPHNNPELRSAITPVDPAQVKVAPVPGFAARLWPRWVSAMTIPWCVYVRADVLAGDRGVLARLVCHELVHVRQWRTEGRFRFGRRYLGAYLRGRIRRLSHREAYLAIPYETEARVIVSALSS